MAGLRREDMRVGEGVDGTDYMGLMDCRYGGYGRYGMNNMTQYGWKVLGCSRRRRRRIQVLFRSRNW